jgi:hypothetical protein
MSRNLIPTILLALAVVALSLAISILSGSAGRDRERITALEKQAAENAGLCVQTPSMTYTARFVPDCDSPHRGAGALSIGMTAVMP